MRKTSGAWGPRPQMVFSRGEKSQIAHRLNPEFVRNILKEFNSGAMDWQTAAERLQIGRAQLYKLRAKWIQNKDAFQPELSGGNHKEQWPEPATHFIQEFLPHCQPLNFALIADELHRRFKFKRSRRAVAQYVRQHFPLLASAALPGPKERRRWQTARIGELWQHDSSIHQWWPSAQKQCLIMTIDDHSRKIIKGVFASDTTWDHFCHFRTAFETIGLPEIIYTDGLSLFGHATPKDRLDTHSQFQRALHGLQVAHLVAPDAQAKGKIERLFGTVQRRLVSLFSYEKVQNHDEGNQLLQAFIQQHNQHQINRTTKLTPDQAWEKALEEKRTALKPTPPEPLLNLHLAVYTSRLRSSASTIDFLGKQWPITTTKTKYLTIIHHPNQRFWVVETQKTFDRWPMVLGAFTL